MFKRVFFGLLGLGAGVALGGYAVRKLERAQRRLSPQARRPGGALQRFNDAMRAGRTAAAEREAELRAVYTHNGQIT